MELTFDMDADSQKITLTELDVFQDMINLVLPEDYRQHMLANNGGVVEQDDIEHVNYRGDEFGISYFYPIKYGYDTMENTYASLNNKIPSGYLAIGVMSGGGEIIISLNNDATYGNTKSWYEDGTILDLSPSFTDLINDMVEIEE
ncbi:SMI1/KNR4 family protein [Polaribacter batillariae]|uniref:SMI1/KNR4 family protein n=1 Tax=Polaribacter batillariae TaxID=2808900 RepID=A0ABX7SZ80_9FLAO|nr:SMI1/KNR4 family protein [Polaribacter batillariae]QTD39192.1 SMI1/KNR4 family protein [Polaribacter batillariae]